MNRATTARLNISLDQNIIESLREISKEEQIPKTTVARKLIVEGILNWRMHSALKLYREGRITKERAAEIAGVSTYDIIETVQQQGYSSHYNLEDLREDLKLLSQRA